MKKQKRPFTLVEMLIVTLLLCVAAGAIGFNIVKMIKEQRFKSAVEWVSDRLQTAQNFSSVFKSDIFVTMELDSDRIFCRINSEKNLPKNLVDLLENEVGINGIKSFIFEDKRGYKQTNRAEIKFTNKTHSVTPGTITFSADEDPYSNGSLNKKLSLQAVEEQNQSEELYPKEIRNDWRARNS